MISSKNKSPSYSPFFHICSFDQQINLLINLITTLRNLIGCHVPSKLVLGIFCKNIYKKLPKYQLFLTKQIQKQAVTYVGKSPRRSTDYYQQPSTHQDPFKDIPQATLVGYKRAVVTNK